MRRTKNRFEVVPLAKIAPLLNNAQEVGPGKAAKPARILSVSHDQSLAATREMLFTTAGLQVSSVSTIGQAVQLCADGSFDLIVIGHSIAPEQKELLLRELRHRCSTPTLVLHRYAEAPLAGANYTFDSAEGPALLLETVLDILKQTTGTRPSGKPIDRSIPAPWPREHRTIRKPI